MAIGIPIFGSPDSAFTLAQQLTTTAEAYATQLIRSVQDFTPVTINATFPTIGDPPTLVVPDAPTLEAVSWTVPSQPADFTLLPPDLTHLFPADFNGVAPTLTFGSLPQPSFGAVPTAPGVDFNFVYPNPSVTLPPLPTLLTLDTVSFLDLTIPDFTGVVPTLTIGTPSPIGYVEGATYTSDLLTDVTTSLQKALTDNTDTGLATDVQQAMFDAAREREYRANADGLLELDRMENLGFAFPPGVWLDARIKAQTELAKTLAGESRDIFIKQAELHLENVMKSRELAISLEGHWMDYTNNVHQRLFESAKFLSEFQVSVYNAQVQAFTARIEGFKATIAAYDAFIRGIEARIAQKKAQVDFEVAKVQINTALVDQYKAEIEAAMSVLEIAKVQVEIIQTRANVEKTKVDVFGAQVQAYVATVNAYTAEVEGYKANAEAQGAIEGVFRTQVEAYTAQVQAGASKATALVTGYEAQVKGYEAKLDGYKATLQAMVEQARATSEFNQSATAEYTALISATSAYNQALTTRWQAIINEQLQIAEIGVKVGEANAQLQISQRQIIIDAIKAAATILSQLGAAALNAIHFSNTSNWGLNTSISTSSSTSTSTSENHNFNESA